MFTLLTDHKPLVGPFKSDRAVPAMAAALIQRSGSSALGACFYVTDHNSGKANVPADALSRLLVTPGTAFPPSEPAEGFDSCEYALLTESNNDGVMLTKQLVTLAAKNQNLTKVNKWVHEG